MEIGEQSGAERFPRGMGPMARFLYDSICYFQKDLLRSRDDPGVCAAIDLLDVVVADSIPDESRLAAWETILGLLGLDEDEEDTDGEMMGN